MKDVYLLSGFLGSGKTTLLKNLISQMKKQNLKPAVLMNELGALGFDSDAVDDDVPLRELLEGCICCSPAEKTEAELQRILYDGDFDVLLIETTGAAHPVAALDVILSPLFADHFHFKGIITVIDSVRFLKREQLPVQTRTLFLEQIRHGHLLLINKTDLLPARKTAEIVFSVQQINPHATIVETSHANVNLNQLQDLTVSIQTHKESRIGKELLLGSRLIELTEAFPQHVVEDWIAHLPDTIYRVKGYIQLPGGSHPHLFQYAYGMTQWLQEDVKIKTQLVVIGEQVHSINDLDEYVLLSIAKQLYPSRERIQTLTHIDELSAAMDEELLDHQTHPRLRQTMAEKSLLLEKKIQQLDCSMWEERYFMKYIKSRVSALSTTSNM